MYVDDSVPQITFKMLFRKVSLPIQRFQRESSRSSRESVTMETEMMLRRLGAPDRKKGSSSNRLRYRDGTIMECTGCGSKDQFYRDCSIARNRTKANSKNQMKSNQFGSNRNKIKYIVAQHKSDE